jgi:hypothetical protein
VGFKLSIETLLVSTKEELDLTETITRTGTPEIELQTTGNSTTRKKEAPHRVQTIRLPAVVSEA